MKNKLLYCGLAILILASFVGVACAQPAPTPSPTPSPTPVKTLTIGEIETLTGVASEYLGVAAKGAEVAKEYINDKGGITVNGQKYMIDIALDDSKQSADGAMAAANRLIYDKKVKFIFGSFPPTVIKAIYSVAEPAGVLYAAIFNVGTKDEYGPNTPLQFVTGCATWEGLNMALAYLKETRPEVKNIAYVLVDDGQIQEQDAKVRKLASSFGFTIAGDIVGFPPDIVDYAPTALKAMALKPDAIMIGNGMPLVGNFVKVARETGYTKTIFSANYYVAEFVLAIAGKESATNYFSEGITMNAPDMPAITREVVDRIVAKTKGLDPLLINGFNGLFTLVQAIEKAQSLDPKVVASAWEKMDTIDTAYGPGRMGGMEMYGIRHTVYHPMGITLLENGELKFGKWLDINQIYRP